MAGRRCLGFAAVVAAMTFALAGCQPPQAADPLVGTWRTEGAGMNFTYTFHADGTVRRAASMGAMEQATNGAWRTVEDRGRVRVIELKVTERRRTTTEEMTITFLDDDHATLLPAGAEALGDQLLQRLTRVAR